MSDSEERLVKHLTDAIVQAAIALHGVREALASGGTVSRCDLYAAEARIVKAFGERVSPQQLQTLSTKLEAATEPLAKAVAENQPG